ncbi:MAG: YggT family protein [Spirochaetaceae bacterium]|nr:YggT family protein [Spirochaetaceae bacterium]
MFQTSMRIVSGVLNFYSILVFVRIILTWFPMTEGGRLQYFLARITDPFLNMFRGKRIFQIGNMDFSPIAAFILLSIAINITRILSRLGGISAGAVLFIGFSAITGAAVFLAGMFSIIVALRLAAYVVNADTYYSPFWRAIDAISAPVIFRITRVFFPKRIVRYKTSLIISLASLAAVIPALSALKALLGNLLLSLPF